jgi:hypothetical protein
MLTTEARPMERPGTPDDLAVGHRDGHVDGLDRDVEITRRLIARFGQQLPTDAVRAVVHASRADLTAGCAPATALPELLERCAAQRLTALAASTPVREPPP